MEPSIGILIFEDVEELDFVGPWEVLTPKPALAERAARLPWRRAVSHAVASPTLLRTGMRAATALDAIGLSRLRRRLPGIGLLPARLPGPRVRSSIDHSIIPAPAKPRLRVGLRCGSTPGTDLASSR